MMKHSSVFINDAAEAGRLIKEMPSKGPIYAAFRYDAAVPDLLGNSGCNCVMLLFFNRYPLKLYWSKLNVCLSNYSTNGPCNDKLC